MSSKKKNKNNSGGDTSAQPTVSKQTTGPMPSRGYRVSGNTAPGGGLQQQKSKRIGPFWKSVLTRLQRSRGLQLGLVLIIALLPSLYFYHASRVAEEKANAPSSAKLQTTAEVVKQVSRHILLPSGEQPTVATVSDASKVRNQAFFVNAASGDKVLIYAQARKAYLYRPSIDRIVEVAPLAPSKTGQ